MASGRARLAALERFVAKSMRRAGTQGIKDRARDATSKYAEIERQLRWKESTPQFRDDIRGYCMHMGVSLTPQQERVFEVLQRDKKVLVPSGNGVGKSFLAAILASWHYDCYSPSETIVSAPNLKQVQDIIFKELRELRRGDPYFMRRAPRLHSSHNHFIDGLTAKTATGFQGRHSTAKDGDNGSVMVIFDEAEDIPKDFWEAAHTMAHYFVAIYNPTTTGSQAATEERSGHWPIVPLNALEHPNVTEALAGRVAPIPTAVTLADVRSRLNKWARKVEAKDAKDTDVLFDGVWYRPGPAAEARILGRRPTSAVDTIFSESTWKRVAANAYDIDSRWPIQIGVDVARFGDDYTVIHGRKGFCSVLHESYNGYDTTAVAKLVEQAIVKISGKSHIDYNTPIYVDAVGVGAGVIDKLREMGFDPTPVHGGHPSNSPTEYPNVRSELLFALAEVCDKGLVDFSRLHSDHVAAIRDQMMAPKYKLDKRGRRVAEEKALVKARINRSPDDLDAVALAYFPYAPCKESFS
jgi:hypothetical protein